MRAAVLQQDPPQSGDDADTDPFVLYAGLSEKQLRRARRVMSRMETEKSLGEVLLELGDVTAEEFERIQFIRRVDLSLIDVLRDEGRVTDDAVATYHEAKRADPNADDHELLVDAGHVTEEGYLRALATTHKVAYAEPSPGDVVRELLNRASLPYLRRLNVIPVAEKDSRLQLATAGPLDRAETLELEQIFKLPIDCHYATADHLAETLRALERRQATTGGPRQPGKITYGAADGGLPRGEGTGQETVRLVDGILLQAIELGASDVHIQPSANSLRVRVRIDGRLRPL